MYSSYKCGSKTQLLNLTNDVFKIEASGLETGDVCMYQFNYNGTDQQYKIWFDSISKAEVTLIDGIRTHPWLDPNVLKENFLAQFMTSEDNHEFGDGWYNFTSVGRAYLFIKSTE